MKQMKKFVSIALFVGLVNGALITSKASAGLAVGSALVVSGVYANECPAWKITGIVTGSVVLVATVVGSAGLFAAAPFGAGAALGVGTLFFDQEAKQIIEQKLPFLAAPEVAEFVALAKAQLANTKSDIVVLSADDVHKVMEKGDYNDVQIQNAVAVFAN